MSYLPIKAGNYVYLDSSQRISQKAVTATTDTVFLLAKDIEDGDLIAECTFSSYDLIKGSGFKEVDFRIDAALIKRTVNAGWIAIAPIFPVGKRFDLDTSNTYLRISQILYNRKQMGFEYKLHRYIDDQQYSCIVHQDIIDELVCNQVFIPVESNPPGCF